MSQQRWILWFALAGLSVGATMLHLRIHPPDRGFIYLVANLICGLDLMAVCGLFLFRRTAVWGLLLNSFFAILGIVLMTDFAVVGTLSGMIKVRPADDWLGWFLHTTFPYLTMTFSDFLVGVALFRTMTGPGRAAA